MQVCGVDDVTHGFDAIYELAEVSHHVLPLNYLGIARKRGRQKSLVNKRLKAHHNGVVCKFHEKNNTTLTKIIACI